MLEYRVIECGGKDEFERAVNNALNEEGWKLHGGVSAVYVPTQHYADGTISSNDYWVFLQGLVRGDKGRLQALKKHE